MSPREEFVRVRLPKGWTPAKIMEYAKVVDLLSRNGQLAAEVRALRRERRELLGELLVARIRIGEVVRLKRWNRLKPWARGRDGYFNGPCNIVSGHYSMTLLGESVKTVVRWQDIVVPSHMKALAPKARRRKA